MTSYAWFVRGEKHAALAQTSMAAVRRADPQARLIVATDEAGLTVPGAEMVRFAPGLPLMVANVEAQLTVMWSHRTPVWFIDTDVLILKPLPEQREEGITVTWRDTVGGEIEDMPGGVAEVMPYNYGVIGVLPGPRVIEAFLWVRERIRRMSPQLQLWWGNQIALAAFCGQRPETPESEELRAIPWRIEEPGPQVRVRKIPGDLWNYTPRSIDDDLSAKGAVHFKGHTRPWMKPVADSLQLTWHEQDFHVLTRGWSRAKGETICGRGSTMSATESVRRELPGWFRNYGIRSLADAGAGDRNWSRHLDLEGVAYRGFDLCPRHETVEPFDITSEVLPSHDAILCRHVLNHLTDALVGETLARFRQAAEYLIANTYPDGVNASDAKLGMWTKWNLAHWLGEPLETRPDIEGVMAIWRLK